MIRSAYKKTQSHSSSTKIGTIEVKFHGCAVNHQPVTVESQVKYYAIACGVCGGQSSTGTGFFLSTSFFSFQYHSSGVLCPFIHSFTTNAI
jgi:hypothetical protein